MKRLLIITGIIAASLITAPASMAQDIIHTYDSTPVKAKILEIGDNYMYYKTWDNPDGPLYSISLSKVVKIVFENGTTKIFAPSSPYIGPGPYGTHPLDYRWGHYYNPYGRLSRGQIADYIGYSLYGSEYMQASNRYSWGIYLTCAGVGCILVTVAAHIASIEMESINNLHGIGSGISGSNAGAAAGYIVGAGCLGAGIPLWVKGNRGLRKIADDYNRTYINPDRNENSPNLSLGSTRNGIGLALNF